MRVLSVQSTVTFGYVGNKCSSVALNLHGVHCDPVHTVHLSNHTGYPSCTGARWTDGTLTQIIKGLAANSLLDRYAVLLSGYLGAPGAIGEIRAAAEAIRSARESVTGDFLFVCDPVMGDAGKLYVPAEMVRGYQDLIQLADVVLPNQTEAELLSGTKIVSELDALKVCLQFHKLGIKHVVITSMDIPSRHGVITVLASSYTHCSWEYYLFDVVKRPMTFTGTGDLFAALFVAWISKANFKEAVAKSLGSLQAVVNLSFAKNSSEIWLIESKTELENPSLVPMSYALLELDELVGAELSEIINFE